MQNNEESKLKASTSPFLSREIYKNYASTMKEKNHKRAKGGLGPINVRSFEDWSSS